ncbi:deoxyribodipyrimidine photo-lyase [Mycobacterium xenopi RIVM700367]|uniref:cryptochrome/photolyase family protein n=1 Tax=Mycobacterium xenopi TaxID=1789 RepID=UPI00025ADCE2|nr:deoxyribodipyrimidine photo-lyase [Mycobacterium xenopi]EID09004.1 deoxyribodipyrimidine photo-lyase [Mycobacterium xenopi RIVM700367]
MTVTMALFTRDLRVHDNPVLTAAHRGGDAVVPVFVLDEAILSSDYVTPNKAAFLVDALTDLDDELRRRGGRLIVRRGQFVDEVLRVVDELSITDVHIAADVSAYSQRRERRLRRALAGHGCGLHVHAGSITVAEPGSIVPSGGDHFTVFTPYYRRWLATPGRKPLRAPTTLTVPHSRGEPIPRAGELCPGAASPRLATGGESTGRRLLSRWLYTGVDRYDSRHDDLAADATSRLSPYLHFGCLSPTEIAHRTTQSSEGRKSFVRQLAWRDFHHQVLAARPEAARSDYRTHHDRWHHNARWLDAWRDGRTGYPIVDAGMRQLAAEGWMHNRARLITASFLAKTLYLDWRLGAAHFMSLLVDADVANNQLNWQWVAGTGTDTRPNRVLNPIRQAQRYDPNGDYVRRWIPELADICGPDIHTPWQRPGAAPDYPPRIVDHLEAATDFKAARSGATPTTQ